MNYVSRRRSDHTCWDYTPISPAVRSGNRLRRAARQNQKVTASHLKRSAYLYVRQSTVRQVFENTESTERQYALRSANHQSTKRLQRYVGVQ